MGPHFVTGLLADPGVMLVKGFCSRTRRELMESLSIPVGYGVELSTLLDTAAKCGLDGVAQVDRPQLQQFVREGTQVRPVSRPVPVHERPPTTGQ